MSAKRIIVNGNTEAAEENQGRDIGMEELRSIWNDAQTIYTDAELQVIRNWLCDIATVIITTIKRQNNATNIILLNNANDETKESHSLRSGKHRRAS